MTTLATAFVVIRPDTKGFLPLLRRNTAAAAAVAGSDAGTKMGGAFKSKMASVAKLGGVALGGAAAIGAASFAKNAMRLEAEFSKTMSQFQASTDLPADGMKRMQDLALKMGADTVFSANDASKAMLAMAKSGIKPATIEAGGLEAALLLAAAGEMEMGAAAEVMGNALNTFGLEGKDAAAVSSALAGAANASSASVESLAMGLQQVGAVAADADQTVQQTTGAMAALANAGIAGSDAGTSLKTMLANLLPATKAARDAFESYGLSSYQSSASMKELLDMGIKPVSKSMPDVTNAIRDYLVRTGQATEGTMKLEDKTRDLLYSTGMMQNAFVKSNGEFKSLTQISGILEEKFGDLSSSERAAALQTLFGADARRAATILTREGAEGLAKYVKATSDQGAAEKMAAAGMKGTAGALEALQGSWETLQLQLGLLTAPAREAAMRTLTELLNRIVPAIKGIAAAFSGDGSGVEAFSAQVGKAVVSLRSFGVALLPTIRDLGEKLAGAFKQVSGLVTGTLLPAFAKMLPILAPVAKFLLQMFGSAVVGFIKGVVQAVKGFVNVITGAVDLFSALIRGDWSKAWRAVKQIARGAVDAVVGLVKAWFNFGILAIFKQGAKKLLGSWRGLWVGLRDAGAKALASIQSLISRSFAVVANLFTTAVRAYLGFWRGLFGSLRTIATNGWRVLRSAFGGAVAAIRTVLTQAVQVYLGFWRGLFANLRNIARSSWEGIRTTFGSVLGGIKDGFRNAVEGIGRIWGGLKEAARAPVEFIVNTVYMDGIRRVVNAIPGAPSLPTMSFAAGGVMPGYTPGRDVHHFVSPTAGHLNLSGGEAILRPEFTRAVGGEEGVAALNAAARRGGKSAVARAMRNLSFFLGGVMPASGDVTQHSGYSWAQWAGDINVPGDETGNPVRAWGPGTVSSTRLGNTSYGNHIRVNHPGGRRTLYAHLSSILAGVGQNVAAGQLIGRVGNTGNSSGPHLHFELAGGSDPISYSASGAKAASDPREGFWGAIGKVKDFVKNLPAWFGKLGNMGAWGDMMLDSLKSSLGDMRKWINNKIPGPGPMPTFDQGGIMRGYGVNRSGKPERVLSPWQTRLFERDVKAREDAERHGGPGGRPVNVEVNFPTTTDPEAAYANAGGRLVSTLSAMGI